jgi:hypothetical protein
MILAAESGVRDEDVDRSDLFRCCVEGPVDLRAVTDVATVDVNRDPGREVSGCLFEKLDAPAEERQ